METKQGTYSADDLADLQRWQVSDVQGAAFKLEAAATALDSLAATFTPETAAILAEVNEMRATLAVLRDRATTLAINASIFGGFPTIPTKRPERSA